MEPKPFDEKDAEAARRALDYYLNPPLPRPVPLTEEPLVIARDDLTPQEAVVHAQSLLRCVVVSALEVAERSGKGPAHDLTLSLMHMVNMARALLSRSEVERKQVSGAAVWPSEECGQK